MPQPDIIAAPRAPAGPLQAWRDALIPSPHAAATPLGGRDARLDMFRGIALVMIFINHVPGTIYENFTSRNFGFSDAAEAFVFMSGLSAGLAYSNGFRLGPFWLATATVWARARQLYFVHLTITLLSIAIFASAALWLNLPEILTTNNIEPLLRTPLSTLVGIPTLLHQFGYLNILPLYIVLLLATPLLLAIALRRPIWLLVASVCLWAIAGQFRLNIPNFPVSGGWFLNPFTWQILFVVGLLSGAAMKVGTQFVPRNRKLFAIAAGFVILVLIWVKIPQIGTLGREILGLGRAAGLPFYITGFDKTFVALPRLLHALALFYVMASLPLSRTFANHPASLPFRILGQQGLAVFATGTVLSMVLQVIKSTMDRHMIFDGLLLATGLLLQFGLAWALTRTVGMRRAGSPR